jgi:hypothetical protein
MRILIAVVLGVLIAGASSVAIVRSADSTPSPSNQTLYNYGSR